MAMLADLVELVIGVDTHTDTHTAAVVTAATGAVLTQVSVAAAPAGYQQLLRLADRHHGQRGWAVESTGGYGAGLTRVPPGTWRAGAGAGPAQAARSAATAPSPTRRMPPGQPVRPWAVTSSPSPAPPASGRHCRCG
jgi:transposase